MHLFAVSKMLELHFFFQMKTLRNIKSSKSLPYENYRHVSPLHGRRIKMRSKNFTHFKSGARAKFDMQNLIFFVIFYILLFLNQVFYLFRLFMVNFSSI